MTIREQLSSQRGDRTEASNLQVVARCLAEPALLAAIADGLASPDGALVGDCAEVLTHVAEEHPKWVAPHAAALGALLTSKVTRVRWEAMHALALVAAQATEVIAGLLPRLGDILRGDRSVIVRDYAVDAVGNYAATSAEAAQEAYPLLMDALTLWDGKQAPHALEGLANVARARPALANPLREVAMPYADDRRGRARRAARALLKATQPA